MSEQVGKPPIPILRNFIDQLHGGMIRFILNDTAISTELPPATPMLEFIRRHERLTGSKLACGEGECGACTVLVGTLNGEQTDYISMTSCIMPIANAQGKHIVTVEGLDQDGLSRVQQAMVDTMGTQCGFCTPGFVVSLTGALLRQHIPTIEELIAAMDGNVCRCTGYHSIIRAAKQVRDHVAVNGQDGSLTRMIDLNVVPGYFSHISERLKKLETARSQVMENGEPGKNVVVGGGTDLYVQKPHAMRTAPIYPAMHTDTLDGITLENDTCTIGASVTMQAMQSSSVVASLLPDVKSYFDPIGSTQIRNMATIGGNLVNASPIGDTTIMFLALNSEIVLYRDGKERTVPLNAFYLGYKQLDLKAGEILTALRFKVPPTGARFSFERVCKRAYLDIASVNSACLINRDDDHVITMAQLSIGGVAPVPLYLKNTSAYLVGRKADTATIAEAMDMLNNEISPIDDIRGSAQYKRLLARQLFLAHMQTGLETPVHEFLVP